MPWRGISLPLLIEAGSGSITDGSISITWCLQATFCRTLLRFQVISKDVNSRNLDLFLGLNWMPGTILFLHFNQIGRYCNMGCIQDWARIVDFRLLGVIKVLRFPPYKKASYFYAYDAAIPRVKPIYGKFGFEVGQ